MRYKLLTYSFFVFVLLVTSCVEFADCSKKELFTDVQEKKVSVNIFVDQSDEVIQFNWYFSDGFSKATTEPIVEHTLIQNGEYSVEVEVEKTNGDVCSYDGFFLIHDETSVEDTCDIDISALEINGSYLTAKVSLDGGVDGAEFCWNTGDGFSLKSTSNEFFYEYPQSGVFNFVVGYNRGACKDSAKKVVTVEPIDVEIPCSVVLDSLPQFIGKTVYLKVEQLQETGIKYAWVMGDGTNPYITSDSYFQYTYDYPGVYVINVTVEHGECFAEKEIEIIIPQGTSYE